MFSRPHASTAQPSRPTTAAYSSLKPCTPGAWLGEACGFFHSTNSSRRTVLEELQVMRKAA